MRSIYGPGRLLLASKKPRIQQLIKDADNLSVDQIKQLKEKPDVIRGLIEIKELGKGKGTNAELIATLMQKSHISDVEPHGAIYQFHGEPFWIKTKLSELQIATNWYWLEMSINEINISSNTIKISKYDLTKLKTSSSLVKTGTLEDLKQLEKDRVSKLL